MLSAARHSVLLDTNVGCLLVLADKSSRLLLQVLGEQATLCTCGRELLNSLGGEAALRALFQSGSTTSSIAASVAAFEHDGSDEEGSSTAGGSVVEHTYRGKPYYVVRVGDSREESGLAEWAVVGYHGGDLWCLFCPSGRQRGCFHVEMARSAGAAGASATGSASGSSPWLDAATFEERLSEALDLETGTYILKCKSRVPLKERTRDDPVLLALLEGQRACGTVVVGGLGGVGVGSSCLLCCLFTCMLSYHWADSSVCMSSHTWPTILTLCQCDNCLIFSCRMHLGMPSARLGNNLPHGPPFHLAVSA
jgi:hypothetical protein